MFWTNNKILSYNKPFNFVIGERTGGKTFDSKNLAIRTFKNDGKLTVWIRREKTELSKQFRMQFFTDVQHLWKDSEFEIKANDIGAVGYINGEPFIFFVALSVWYKHKSIPFNNVKWIIFDEFIVNPNASQRYLKGEAFSFFEVYHTVARPYEREVDGVKTLIDPKTRVLFLGNSVSVVNPYFLYLNIYPSKTEEFTQYPNAVIQIWNGTEHQKYMETTSLGQAIDGTKYKAYAQDNEFYLDNDAFISKKPKGSFYLCGFSVEQNKIGCWINYERGKVYINSQVDPSHIMVAVHNEDHEPNVLMIQYFKRTAPYKELKLALEHGLIMYDNQMTKSLFYDIFGML